LQQAAVGVQLLAVRFSAQSCLKGAFHRLVKARDRGLDFLCLFPRQDSIEHRLYLVQKYRLE
ncbi:MAG: hypothetical protein R6V55_13115, partial [Desulfovermiculus sp.]